MNRLLKIFMDICLLRAGPQHLPASRFLLTLTLVMHAALGVVFALFTLPLPQALVAAAIGTALLVGVVQALLLVHGKAERVQQTATALAGSEILLGLLALLPTAWFYTVESNDARVLPSLLSLLAIVWSVVVTVHIFRAALQVSQGMALLFALGYTIMAYSVLGLVV
ncbi:MAG: hypothetical protein CVV05_03185 [Gammaproteobacteria bacterium HGW-Gammaproteobacteria-1]|nr:MAG: hypothetical protein CVV05_03185 [Gammaproteobacteria bacterium HGW-Gammaproteobacteria-1]